MPFLLISIVLISGCAQKFSNMPYDKPGPVNCNIIQDSEKRQDCALTNLIRSYDLANKFDYSDGSFEMTSDMSFYVKDKNNDEIVDDIEFEFEINSKKSGKYDFQITLDPLDENYKWAVFSDVINVNPGKNKINIVGNESMLDSLAYTANIVIAKDFNVLFRKNKGHFINLTPFKFPTSQKKLPRGEEEKQVGEFMEEEKIEIDTTLPDLMFEKAELTETETGVKADLIVKNNGNDTAFVIFVEAFIDGEPLYGKTNHNQKNYLRVGASWPLSLDLPKANEIMLYIDDNNFVDESNEDNNIYMSK